MSGLMSLDEMDEADEAMLSILHNAIQKSDLVDVSKASFGGDRSEAGRYAANIRWQGHAKGGGGNPPEPLQEQIDRTAQSLAGLGKLPLDDGLKSQYQYATGLFTEVRLKNGKTQTVLAPTAMRVEAEVNALGKRVLGEAGARVVKSGFCTQQELDDAIAYQSRPSEKDAKAGLAKSLMDRAMDKDPKVYPLVKDAVDEYERLKIEAKVAKGLLIKATKEYKKTTAEQGYTQDARQAYQIRVEMQRANVMAKYELNRAQQVLDARLSDLSFDDDAPLNSLRTEIQQAGSVFRSENHQRYLDIHREVGQEVKRIIGEYRPMAEKYPVYVQTKAPPSSPTIFVDGKIRIPALEKQEKFVQEVASRFPQSLLSKIPPGVTVTVKTMGGGGSWSDKSKMIQTDLDDPDTFTHETIHALTFYSRAMRLMETAVQQRRIWGKSGDATTPMAEKIKQGRQREVGPTKVGLSYSRGKYIVDDFVEPYQGRIYPDNYTETLTVATENLFGGGRLLRSDGRADRDLMATALGALLTAEKTDD